MLLYGQSRIFFKIAKDGLLPKMFSEVHPSLGTPYKSQLLIGIIVAIVAALTPIDILGEMVSIGTLFAFALVCGAVIYLRRSDAEISGPFRTPGVPFVPSLGIAFSLLLMVFLPWETWLRLIVWLAIGLALYFAYGRSPLGADERREALSGARQSNLAEYCGHGGPHPECWARPVTATMRKPTRSQPIIP